MIAKKIYGILLLLMLVAYSGMSQKLDCMEQLPYEKVVLHLDKTYCVAGDSVWFKAYCLQADKQRSTLSKVLYVEVYNETKKTIVQQKFKLVDGTTWGAIGLPESAKTGHYFLRAYTQYMRNFSILDYYHQELTIINPFLSAVPFEEQNQVSLDANPTNGIKVYSKESETIIEINQPILTNNKPQKLTVFSQEGTVLFSKQLAIQSPIEKIIIPNESLESGQHYAVLSNEITTNLATYPFYRSMGVVAPEIENLQKVYGQRALVQLNIKLPEMDMADISLVVRKQGLAGQSNNTLSSVASKNPWLLPTYFSNNGEELTKEEHIPANLLMELGELYKKESAIFGIKPPTELKYIPEINNVSLSGVIRNKVTKMPASDVLAMAAIIDEKTQLHLVYTKENGTFIFDLNNQQADQNLFVSTDKRENEELEVLINNDFATVFPEVNAVPLQIDSIEHRIIENLYLESELKKNYEPTPKKGVFTNKEVLSAKANIVNPDIRITLSDYIDIPSLREIFTEIVPGISIKKKNNKSYLNIFNIKEQIALKDALVLLDNVPIFDIDQLLEISPKKIESIDVFNTPYMLGEYKIKGLIRIKTNTLDFAGYVWENESAFVNFKTISKNSVFQQSIYTKNSRTPDFRNVVYWNPNLMINNASKAVEFYTSDMTGTYEILINGFTKKGLPCYKQVLFEVKK